MGRPLEYSKHCVQMSSVRCDDRGREFLLVSEVFGAACRGKQKVIKKDSLVSWHLLRRAQLNDHRFKEARAAKTPSIIDDGQHRATVPDRRTQL